MKAPLLTDLTEAMGITRPSLYAARSETRNPCSARPLRPLRAREARNYIGKALAEPTARRVAEAMLRGAVENVTSCDEPHGYLGAIASVACGEEAKSIRDAVEERSKRFHESIIERFEAGERRGRPAPADRRRRPDRPAQEHCSKESRSRPGRAPPAKSSTGWSRPA